MNLFFGKVAISQWCHAESCRPRDLNSNVAVETVENFVRLETERIHGKI